MNICLDYIDPEEKETLSKDVNKSYELKPHLHCNSVSNATILPIKRNNWQYLGGVMLQDGLMVASSGCFDFSDGRYDFEEEYVEKKDEVAIYVGCFQSVWGHMITDNLKKLWFLNTDEGKNLIAGGGKVYYTTIEGEPVGNVFWELLKLVGFEKELFVEQKTVCRYKEIYIPDNLFVSSGEPRFWHPILKKLFETIKKNVEHEVLPLRLPVFEKLYFTRSKSASFWREMGEKKFEKIFKKLGYEVISPEKLPLINQIWLLMNCKEFAATEGSISHNAVFCNPGTKVTILRKSNWVNYYQIAIDEMAELDVTYIDIHHSTNLNKAVPVAGPFYLCVNRNIEKYVGHKIIHLPYWLDPSYLLYLNRHRIQKLWHKVID